METCSPLWAHSVRTDDGVKGWIAEKRLRLKF